MVKTFFKGFKDEDGFFYLNYFQDLTDDFFTGLSIRRKNSKSSYIFRTAIPS